MTNLADLTLRQFADGRLRGDFTAEEVTRAVLERIASVEPTVHAYLRVDPDAALAAARRADREAPPPGTAAALHGAPIALKDNLCTRGVATTCASRILENFIPPYDATVVARLRASGAVFLGKTNLDEFAMGSSTENSAFGATRNPWDPATIPGGSSGGSAAAVAAGECLAALGSDTGGSIRQPAACCGIAGLKPTYGRVSRYGLMAFASSLDQIGPMARTVEDCAILLEAIAGHDPRDSTSVPGAVPPYAALLGDGRLDGLTVGMVREFFAAGLDAEVERSIREAVRALEGRGARVREVSLPHGKYSVAVYYILATAEASSNLARYDGVKYGSRAAGARDLLAKNRPNRTASMDGALRRGPQSGGVHGHHRLPAGRAQGGVARPAGARGHPVPLRQVRSLRPATRRTPRPLDHRRSGRGLTPTWNSRSFRSTPSSFPARLYRCTSSRTATAS
jgi:aspartyl-tRNA(Asn)/glutamyl-tRNA(Gln) amidotransferase subunit A